MRVFYAMNQQTIIRQLRRMTNNWSEVGILNADEAIYSYGVKVLGVCNCPKCGDELTMYQIAIGKDAGKIVALCDCSGCLFADHYFPAGSLLEWVE